MSDKLGFVGVFSLYGCYATHLISHFVTAFFSENGHPFVATATFPLIGEYLKGKPWIAGTFYAFPLRGRWHFRKKMTDEVEQYNIPTN